MSENRRYYWLKMPEDFFDDDTIDFIESQENGEKYCLFYLKLCLKALKYDGKLIRYVGNMLIPYDEIGLAKLTKTDIDIVRSALVIFTRIGLIERLDSGEIFLAQLNEMVGTETQKAKYLRQKRIQSKNVTLESKNVTPNVTSKGKNVPQVVENCYTEIEIEKELDIEKEKEIEKTHAPKPKKQKYGEFENVSLTDDELSKLKDTLGEKKAFAVINNYSEYKEMKGYKCKSDYLALKRWGIAAYEEKTNKSKKTVKKEKTDWSGQYTDEEYMQGMSDLETVGF